jgi:3D (Asp-Asp-Asp) domain-containing protein
MSCILALSVLLGIAPLAGQGKVRTVEAIVTAYCPCRECCGPNARGITSTGQDARDLSGCAVDPKLIPYGCRVRIPGVGWRTADDTGGAMRKNGRRGIVHIDVRMRTHKQALRFGVRRTTIRIDTTGAP